MGYEANRRVETSARTFAIIERLGEVDRMGVSALADELEMSKGIVHNHLSTLRELGYVRKLDDGYQLSPQLLTLGLRARSNASLYRFADGLCSEFAAQLDAGVALCQHTDGDCTVIETYGIASTADLGVGTALPLGASLVGLVVALAGGRDRSPVEDTSTYDIETLRTSLDADGYATGPLSTERADDCVAAPVLDGNGECHGGVGVLLPPDQRDRVGEATGTLRDRIEARFDAGWAGTRSFATEKHSWMG